MTTPTSVSSTAPPTAAHFVDPRQPSSALHKAPARTTAQPEELGELHRFCREGRLYDVERWICAGFPLQVAKDTPRKRSSRAISALEIAIAAGNHALVVLLLSNGYDPNQELNCPLDVALRARRFDIVDVLLQWGADPREVDLETLFDTYNSTLFARFQDLGVDLTAGHALAEALASHTSNRPLFGFAKRNRATHPKFQAELNIALGHHISRENEKGVQLCLWAGADAYAPAISLRYWRESDEEEDENEPYRGLSAMYHACLTGNASILKRLRPDPARDDFDDLYCAAGSGAIIDLLAEQALPQEVGAVIQRHLWWLPFDREWQSVEIIRRLFQVGARWRESPPEGIAAVRHALLKAPDRVFVEVLKLFATDDYCSPAILKEIARTPAALARMKRVGFIPPSDNEQRRFDQYRPTHSREVLKKFGVALPKPTPAAPPVPPVVWVSSTRAKGKEIHLNRSELFDRVWSQPVAKVAEEWGISGPGLKKVCRRVQVPVPPRGYWAKLQAGHRVRRATLPVFPDNAASQIIFRAPR